jgi:hypothetical protein
MPGSVPAKAAAAAPPTPTPDAVAAPTTTPAPTTTTPNGRDAVTARLREDALLVSGSFFRPAAATLNAAASDADGNITQVQYYSNGALLATLDAPRHIPVVTHVHELEYWITRAGPENLRHAIDRSSAYIAVAQAVRKILGVPSPQRAGGGK